MTSDLLDKALEVICPELIQEKAWTTNKKKETRQNREDQLKVLRLAQKVYRLRTGQKSLKGTDMNRTKLNKIRDEIRLFYKNNPHKDFPLE